MRSVRFVSTVALIITLLLSVGLSAAQGQQPPAEAVPARVPDDQVPAQVNVAGVSEKQTILPAQSDGLAAIPSRVPEDQIPAIVNKVEFTEVITVSLVSARDLDGSSGVATPGTVTLSYGFYWYQWNPWTVAVAGYARTQADFCCTKLRAKAVLWRDVEHDGIWEYMDEKLAERTGICVTDSGEAMTGYWTAPNNTDWKVVTSHFAQWVGGSQAWDRVKYDSFP
jgi:hypothetical protein